MTKILVEMLSLSCSGVPIQKSVIRKEQLLANQKWHYSLQLGIHNLNLPHVTLRQEKINPMESIRVKNCVQISCKKELFSFKEPKNQPNTLV